MLLSTLLHYFFYGHSYDFMRNIIKGSKNPAKWDLYVLFMVSAE